MQFQNGCNKVAIELQVLQFWSEIIHVISNRTCAACLFDFEITRKISDQIALHSVQLPLWRRCTCTCTFYDYSVYTVYFLIVNWVCIRESVNIFNRLVFGWGLLQSKQSGFKELMLSCHLTGCGKNIKLYKNIFRGKICRLNVENTLDTKKINS